MSLLNVSLSSTQPQGNVVVFRQRLWGLIREMTDRLDGIHALITGAASGIGAACARRMAREGVQLLLADLNGDSAKTLADELGQASVQADVTRAADIERMLDLAYQRWGRLDVVFPSPAVARSFRGGVGSHARDQPARCLFCVARRGQTHARSVADCGFRAARKVDPDGLDRRLPRRSGVYGPLRSQ
jgi:NAD(P)-dependent dehydrogenase (short-subunit alcohol dehydrogenase family)